MSAESEPGSRGTIEDVLPEPGHAAARVDLVRALAVLCGPPDPAQRGIGLAAGLGGEPTAEAHTAVLVLQCHPYASVHLGAEGMLGGEAADRVAGFWRALGLTPPQDADRLDRILLLYADLQAAEHEAAREGRGATQEADREVPAAAALARADAAGRARRALLWEHVAPWLPAWLYAVEDTGDPWFSAWAALVGSWLDAELDDLRREHPPAIGALPLALREAPALVDRSDALDGIDLLLDVLVAPVRSGIILTTSRLASAAEATGTGLRRGERRFVLRTLLEQDPGAVLAWLAVEADRWRARHQTWSTVAPTCATWWAERAQATALVLRDLSHNAPARAQGDSSGAASP